MICSLDVFVSNEGFTQEISNNDRYCQVVYTLEEVEDMTRRSQISDKEPSADMPGLHISDSSTSTSQSQANLDYAMNEMRQKDAFQRQVAMEQGNRASDLETATSVPRLHAGSWAEAKTRQNVNFVETHDTSIQPQDNTQMPAASSYPTFTFTEETVQHPFGGSFLQVEQAPFVEDWPVETSEEHIRIPYLPLRSEDIGCAIPYPDEFILSMNVANSSY